MATDTPPASLAAAQARRTPRQVLVTWPACLSAIALAAFCPLTRAAPPVPVSHFSASDLSAPRLSVQPQQTMLVAQLAQPTLAPAAANRSDVPAPAVRSIAVAPRPSATESRSLAFAVVTNLPTSERDAPQAQALLDWIGSQGKVAFIVHLGNIKGPDEPCSDALFASRRALLDSTPAPLIYIPGQADWIDCALPRAGGAEPLERLDAIREGFLSGPTSLGLQTLRVSRQSELPAFRPYRENTRWMDAGIVFVTLDVPSDNNHFLDGGGRNGEYEDREIANRYWIARALTDAKRRQARAIVFFFQGNPHFAHEGRETRPVFAWWFGKKRERDGYLALRRDLVAAARSFPGPVLLIHAGTLHSDRGFSVEPLLHDRNGKDLHNMKRIEVETSPHLTGWLRIQASGGRSAELEPTFHAELEHAPLTISTAPATTSPKSPGSGAESDSGSISGSPPGSPSAARGETRVSAGSTSGTAGDSASHPTGYPSTPPNEGGMPGDEATGRVYPDDAYPEEENISKAQGNASDPGNRDDTNTSSSALGNITTPTLLPLPPLSPAPSSSAAAGR